MKNKLKWKEEKEKSEHSDCLAANIVDYIRQRKFPVLIPEMLRFSKLVTCGQLTKEEAKKILSEHRKGTEEPDNIDWFLGELGISREEMDEVLKYPMRHIQYLKKRNPAIRRIKALKKKRLRLV
jgi:lysyl-tRNA synthetase class I